MRCIDADRQHAESLVRLICKAGDGIPESLWGKMAEPGESVIDVGVRRASREEGAFSYTRARICVDGDRILGMLIGYALPDPYPAPDLDKMPRVLHPLLRLEAMVPGSWYINAVAVFEEYRGRGAGRLLLEDAHRRAAGTGSRETSLIVASTNNKAQRLYADLGYLRTATEAMVPPGDHAGEWILMTRPLGAGAIRG